MGGPPLWSATSRVRVPCTAEASVKRAKPLKRCSEFGSSALPCAVSTSESEIVSAGHGSAAGFLTALISLYAPAAVGCQDPMLTSSRDTELFARLACPLMNVP